MSRARLFIGALTLVAGSALQAQYEQQGNKLVGTGAAGEAQQGTYLAISADGNTAVVGGPGDHSDLGAAWVFTRSNGVWSQQGEKLVGAGASEGSELGPVAISGDGTTIVLGGPSDYNTSGGVWVFTRRNGVWSQQGEKLSGSGATAKYQGTAVALSFDGNTALVGDYGDSNYRGAAWVFTRADGAWTQQGGKLVGTGAIGSAEQGFSVALSADGNTAVVGGAGDNHNSGAVWIFSRSGGQWTQQGDKLVPSDSAGSPSLHGNAVAVSADGNTAIVGGRTDSGGVGAAWVYARKAGTWVQQGGKLVGSDAIWKSSQGYSVDISGDGNVAVVGGPDDREALGAVWVFKRRDGVWSQLGSKLSGVGAGPWAMQGSAVAISADARTLLFGGRYDYAQTGALWVFVASKNVLWVPVASHNTGVGLAVWRSDLGLLNTEQSATEVEVRLHQGGSVIAETVPLPAGAQSVLSDVVDQLKATGSGAIEVRSDQPLKVTSRTYNQSPGGTFGQGFLGVTTEACLTTGQSGWLGQLAENRAFRTNIGVTNTGDTPASVTVELYDGAGALLASYPVSLVPGEWKQETQPFKNRAAQTQMARGYAKVRVVSGSGVVAYASVVDNATGDPTTIDMQRW
jgi:hypothetical protein